MIKRVEQSRKFAHPRVFARLAVLGLVGVCASTPASAQSVEAFSGIVGGFANTPDAISQGCTTYGPPSTLGTSYGTAVGVTEPLGGIAACGFGGGMKSVSGGSSPLSTSQNLAPVPLGNPGYSGRFSSSTEGTADYKNLKASAHGLIAGGGVGSPLSLEGGTGAAFFNDTLTASSPSVTDLSPGFIRYLFKIDGSLSTSYIPAHYPEASYGYPSSAEVRLGLQHGELDGVYQIARLNSRLDETATLSSSDTVVSSFVAGPGSISGSGTFSSTLHGQFQDFDHEIKWNQPFDLKVGLLAGIDGTADANATATLIGVQLFDAGHNPVSNFSIASASGSSYVSAVPEPMSLWMTVIGIMMLGARFHLLNRSTGYPTTLGNRRSRTLS